MIPMPLGVSSFDEMNSSRYLYLIKNIRIWVAENARTLRRFLSSLKLGIKIDELEIYELNRQSGVRELSSFLIRHWQTEPVGVVSEAGIPGMADPGAEVAWLAHKNQVPVIPVSGPSSLFLALSASGLNGQQFSFHGYPPVEEDALRRFLRQQGELAMKGISQAWIETPYRSDRMLQNILRTLPAHMLLCIACNIHDPDGFIHTRTLEQWNTSGVVLGKNPCIFILGKNIADEKNTAKQP